MAALEKAHGASSGRTDEKTLDMPDWAPLFSAMSRGSQAETALRIANISNYVASLQQAKALEDAAGEQVTPACRRPGGHPGRRTLPHLPCAAPRFSYRSTLMSLGDSGP